MKASQKKAVPAGTTANDVINKYITAIGGLDKINALKDFSFSAKGSVQGQDVVFSRKFKVPGKMLLEISLPNMNMTVQKLLVTPDSIVLHAQGQTIPVDDADKQRYTEQALPFPEVNYAKGGYNLELAPMLDNMDGTDVYVVTVTAPSGTVTKKYYDAATGLKIKDEVKGENGDAISVYSEYKEVGGIKIPYTLKVNQQVEFTLSVTDAKVNGGLTDADFK